MQLTKEYLNNIFTYSAGKLYRKSTGKQACPKSYSKGYKAVSIGARLYLEHRIIYTMHNGNTDSIIDHINGNHLDNRIENLRTAERWQNLHNSKQNKRNTSGHKGVFWNKANKTWQAEIYINTVKHYLGTFKTVEAASKAVEEKRKEFCKEFARAV